MRNVAVEPHPNRSVLPLSPAPFEEESAVESAITAAGQHQRRRGQLQSGKADNPVRPPLERGVKIREPAGEPRKETVVEPANPDLAATDNADPLPVCAGHHF